MGLSVGKIMRCATITVLSIELDAQALRLRERLWEGSCGRE